MKILLALALSTMLAVAADSLPRPAGTIYFLADFGPFGTVAEANATYAIATEKIEAAGGGVLLLPTNGPDGWLPEAPAQEMIRTPAPPEPATNWSSGPGVTVLDPRSASVMLPPANGLAIRRDFKLIDGESSPHWRYHPAVGFTNTLASGTSSVEAHLTGTVPAGPGSRFPVSSLAGIFPGQTLSVRLPDGTEAESVVVTDLGMDTASKTAYFVADSRQPLPAGTRLSARDTLNIVDARVFANDQLQTFDIYNIRHQYSQGDSYIYQGWLKYSGDEYAPREDRDTMGVAARSGYGSAIYDARISTDTNIFRGKVEAVDPATGAVTFGEGQNTETLAVGRPLINLNPEKILTEGSAYLLYTHARLSYPAMMRSHDAPWSEDLIGRYFAINEPTEFVTPGEDVRRWFLITGFSIDPEDGSKCLAMRRYWWGAKDDTGMNRLYHWDNNTFDQTKPVFLKYIIAPGSYVNEVSDALPDNPARSPTTGTLHVAPYADSNSNLDFAPGDPIEQAIGPDPFNPVPFRAWMWDLVPSAWPAAVFDVMNLGSTSRTSVMSVQGLNFGSIIDFEFGSLVGNGIEVVGDVQNALIEIHEPKEPLHKPMAGFYWQATNNQLGMNFITGALIYNGAWNLEQGGALRVGGLTGNEAATGKNLRGIGVQIPPGQDSLDVLFAEPEPEGSYAVFIQPGWPTGWAVTEKSASGFSLEFTKPAPAGAQIDWLILR